MEKTEMVVVVPKQLADVINSVRQCPHPQSEGAVVLEVIGLLTDEFIDKLPEGTMTVVKAIRNGYDVEQEYMNFNEALQKMKEGKKVNRLINDKGDFNRYHNPLYLSQFKTHIVWKDHCGEHIHTFNMEDFESNHWYVVD